METNRDALLQTELTECLSKIKRLELELKKYEMNVQNNTKIRELEETLDDALASNTRIVEQLKNCETRITNMRKQCSTYDTKIISLNESIRKLKLENIEYAENYNNLKAQYILLQKSTPKSKIATTSSCLERLIRQTTTLIIGAEIHPTSKLPNFVLFLAHKMGLRYTRQDIVRASKCQDHKQVNNLIVQFRDPRVKEEFFKNAYKLEYYSKTDNIEFRDITGEIFYDNLFEFALNLKLFGYKSVFRRGDKVFTCRNGNDEPIRLYNKEHVEELISEVK